jgi:peptidoglycan LD-endopeptidase CwlK
MKGIEHLHPAAREKAELFLAKCREAGLNVLVLDTLRTPKEQDGLFAKGRDEKGNVVDPKKVVTYARGKDLQSMHLFGLALDFCCGIKGKEWYTGDGFFKKCGEIAKSIGFFWGGDFESPKGDYGHIEYRGFGTIGKLVERWGTPELFLGSW